MTPYVLAFVGGLAGSLHCVGMCGAFPLALAAGTGSNLRQHALYHLVRVNTLIFLSAVSRGLSQALAAAVAMITSSLAVVANARRLRVEAAD